MNIETNSFSNNCKELIEFNLKFFMPRMRFSEKEALKTKIIEFVTNFFNKEYEEDDSDYTLYEKKYQMDASLKMTISISMKLMGTELSSEEVLELYGKVKAFAYNWFETNNIKFMESKRVRIMLEEPPRKRLKTPKMVDSDSDSSDCLSDVNLVSPLNAPVLKRGKFISILGRIDKTILELDRSHRGTDIYEAQLNQLLIDLTNFSGRKGLNESSKEVDSEIVIKALKYLTTFSKISPDVENNLDTLIDEIFESHPNQIATNLKALLAIIRNKAII